MSTSATSQDPDVATAPLDTFALCHESIVQKLRAVETLPGLVDSAARARQLARDTLAFFQGAVLDHHREEEKELFPTVLAHAQAGSEREHVKTMVEHLTAEHREIEATWRQLQPQLEKVSHGADVTLDTGALERMVKIYMAHAQKEESQFLPQSRQILGRHSEDLSALGLNLHIRHVVNAARRGLRGT